MEYDDQLAKNAPEVPPLPAVEEDDPKITPLFPKAKIKELKAKGKQTRKNADSDYARKRDMVVTVTGIVLVFILILLYWLTAFLIRPNDYLSSFLYLLNSVIMLILGYIFTKITQR
jgi:hypothetical protein